MLGISSAYSRSPSARDSHRVDCGAAMAMSGMVEWRRLMAVMGMVVALVVGGGIGGAEAQGTPPQSSGCTTSLLSLSPCLSYVTGNGSLARPSQGCCSALASVVKTSPACLCQLVSSTGNPLGIPINRTAALSLPGACSVTTPPVSQCKAAAAVPAKAPVASAGAGAGSNPTRGKATPPNAKAIPGANSPSSSSSPASAGNIPPTTSEAGNIPSPSPKSASGGATLFTPPMMMMSALVGLMSAAIGIAW